MGCPEQLKCDYPGCQDDPIEFILSKWDAQCLDDLSEMENLDIDLPDSLQALLQVRCRSHFFPNFDVRYDVHLSYEEALAWIVLNS